MFSIIKWLLLLAAVFIVAALGLMSFNTRETRVSNDPRPQLPACPGTPNCVSSLSNDPSSKIEPISVTNIDPATAWQRLSRAIEQTGGEIVRQDERYLHAVYSSALFRFKDDLEAVLSEDRIDIRSASRAGKNDLGKNRQRVEKLKAVYQQDQ